MSPVRPSSVPAELSADQYHYCTRPGCPGKIPVTSDLVEICPQPGCGNRSFANAKRKKAIDGGSKDAQDFVSDEEKAKKVAAEKSKPTAGDPDDPNKQSTQKTS